MGEGALVPAQGRTRLVLHRAGRLAAESPPPVSLRLPPSLANKACGP